MTPAPVESVMVNGTSPSLSTTAPPPVASHLLPAPSASDLILVPATPLEGTQLLHLNAAEWKGPLTMPQYLKREHRLMNQVLTRDGQLTYWILTSSSLPRNEDGTRPILASCETLRKRGFVARNGKVESVVCHGIGSVFTRQEHRGRGYAGRMMVDLGKRLETWQAPDGHKNPFSVLYSDIGRNYYTRFGWKVYTSTHIHLAQLDDRAYDKILRSANLPPVEDLIASDLSSLEADALLVDDLKLRSSTHPNIPHVAIRPDMEHFSWHHAREEYLSSVLNLPHKPLIKGAICRQAKTALIWSRIYAADPKQYQLRILRIVSPVEYKSESQRQEVASALAALLLRAQLEASRSQMASGVEVWSPEDITITAGQILKDAEARALGGGENGETKAAEQVQVITRDKEHICSLRWAGHEEEDQGSDVVWVGNEMYAWC